MYSAQKQQRIISTFSVGCSQQFAPFYRVTKNVMQSCDRHLWHKQSGPVEKPEDTGENMKGNTGSIERCILQ